MMANNTKKTIEYYNQHADDFFNGTVNADMHSLMEQFEELLPEGGTVLDAGCGSGRDAKYFKEHGYIVEAFDASEEMVRKAGEYTGLDVKCCRFEDFDESQRYDGIWACASLLHVKEQDIDAVMQRLEKALKPGGIIYVSFKYGNGERRRGERFFLDMDETELTKLFDKAGLDIERIFETIDVREGRSDEKWINGIGRKGIGVG